MLRLLRGLLPCAGLVIAFWSCSPGKLAEGEPTRDADDESSGTAGSAGATSDDDDGAAAGAACSTTDDCVLAQERCCQDCDATDRPFIAQTRSQFQRYKDEQCPLPKCGPPDYGPGELECRAEHYALTAVCDAGQCK